MGKRRSPATAGIADLPDEDRLAQIKRALAEGEQAPSVPDAFHIRGDNFDVVLPEKKLDQIQRVDIGFIAGGDDVVETQARGLRKLDDAGAKAAALGDHRQRAALQVRFLKDTAEPAVKPRQ